MNDETKQAATPDEPKRRANSVYAFREIEGRLEWDFGTALGKITLDTEKASASARHFLLKYGAKQWANDGGAVEAGADGKVDPVAKFNGIRERVDLLMAGTEAAGLLRRGAGAGTFSYVTRALVALKTYAGQDVSTYDLANAYVKRLADSADERVVKLGFKGQVGKVRAWLERNSKAIAAEVEKIKAGEVVGETVDADELLGELGDE